MKGFNQTLLVSLLCLPLYAHAQFTVYNNGMATVSIQSGLTVSVLGGYTAQTSGGTNGTMDNQGTLQLTGNWTNNNSAGAVATRNPFSTSAGTVIFTGSNAQTIAGTATTTFYNLTISKAADNVTLNAGTTTVSNGLTMTTGHIISSTLPAASPMLALASAAPISGGSVNSFIVGQVQKIMGAGISQTYPLGSLTGPRYRPASILSPSAGGGVWTLSYAGNDPTSGGFPWPEVNTANIRKVSQFEYWNINRTGGATAGVTLSYDVGSYIPPNIGVLSTLRVARWDAAAVPAARWDIAPGGGAHSAPGTIIAGTVNVTVANAFGAFSLASTDPNSPLPVVWLSFTAERVNSEVLLNWSTAQELNNDRFEIERSEDGRNFYKIGQVPGSGNSSLPSAYRFSDKHASYHQHHYYRIRQVDLDGNFDYSSVAAIYATAEPDSRPLWKILPNPVGRDQSLEIIHAEPSSENEYIDLVIISSSGQVVAQANGFMSDVNEKLKQITDAIPAGVYLLKVTNGTRNEMFRIARY